MKMKIFFIGSAIFCSAIVWQLKTDYVHPILPGGTYTSSCRNITMEMRGGSSVNRLITADCQDANGNLKRTSISLPLITNEYLDFTLENQNGTLKSFQPQLLQ